MNRLRSFDVYRQVPKNMQEHTITGSVVSIVSILLIAYLFFSELSEFLTVEVTSDMFVDHTEDTGNDHAEIHINMNITVPAIPCAIVSVDAQDVMGTHVMDVKGQLHKTRVDADGNVILVNGEPSSKTETPEEQKGEGCRIHGYIVVKRVPGNFHVSAHAYTDLVHIFYPNGNMNCSHIVHDLWFGEETHKLHTKETDAQTNPLAGVSKIDLSDGTGESRSYEYYIKIVPTNYHHIHGEQTESFQFVASSNEIVGRYRLPAIYFRYDMSPITVEFRESQMALSHFLVQVCAIVGGVFTVLGLINSLLDTSIKSVLTKAQLNKLG